MAKEKEKKNTPHDLPLDFFFRVQLWRHYTQRLMEDQLNYF